MNKRIFKQAGLIAACVAISACTDTDIAAITNPADNPVAPSSGDADFAKFVSIGDSITAGYADGALYLLAQEKSFPSILAQQFSAAEGTDIGFNQPLVSDSLGGLLFNSVENPEFANRLILDTESKAPVTLAGTPTTEVIGSGLNSAQFTNMGVPGAKSFHLLAPGYGNPAGLSTDPATANPYFVRFVSDISSTTATVIEDAAAQAPTFFTLWIGNNDVLGYATSGGDGSDLITPTATFDGAYAGLVATINTASNKGVLINIPDVSTLSYFTTVPYNAVPLDAATAETLNNAYAAYNGGLTAAQGLGLITTDEVAKRTISFAEGQNAVVLLDEALTDITAVDAALVNMRQATASDLVVLPASSVIGSLADPSNPNSARGVAVPLDDKDVLTVTEIVEVNTARAAFNATIKAAADADPNLIYVDVAAVMAELHTSGIDFGTGFITSEYVAGGAFSLDGVHPTARGYAVISNVIIDAINSGFNANVHNVDPAVYTTVFFQ